MSLCYLLDTNVLSEPARPSPHIGVMTHLERAHGEVATAAPVWNELLYGCFRLPASKRRQTLERFLYEVLAPAVPVLPYDERAAEWHAVERARLGTVGKTPAFVDGQIAAVARVRGLVLVTRNVADYTDFDGIAIEDWAS
jgi:tRNA(fMet)-specific endonuclease VapC